MRWTLFDGYLFKYCSIKYQTFHQVPEKTSQQTSGGGGGGVTPIDWDTGCAIF